MRRAGRPDYDWIAWVVFVLGLILLSIVAAQVLLAVTDGR